MQRRSWIPRILNLAVFIVLETASLYMLQNSAQLQRVWVSRAAIGFKGAVWGSTQGMRNFFALKSINRDLSRDNARLQQELFRSREMLRAAHLDTMRLRREPGFSMIPAEVVKISRNKQHNYFILNRGYEDGIQEKSGVVTREGAIGIIDAVSAHYAYALSFQNVDFSISARIGTEGAGGPLVWDGRSSRGALLKEIPLQYKYNPGDTVYTSGHSLLFPPDIPLGIAGNARVVNGSTNEIAVTLFQGLTRLRYVVVVHNNAFEEIEQFAP